MRLFFVFLLSGCELSVSLLSQLFRPVVFDYHAAFELLAFDVFKLLGLDDVPEVALVAILFEPLEQVQFMLFELFNTSVEARDSVEHLVVLLLVASAVSLRFITFLVLLGHFRFE